MSQRPNHRGICAAIVTGFHSVTKLPKMASANGLLHRVAAVLDTYDPSCPHMVFDKITYLEILRRMQILLDINSLEVRLEPNKILYSVERLADLYAADIELDANPAQSVIMKCRDRIVCVIETEFWCFVGGPNPYHDSYTYSVYVRNDEESRQVQQLLRKILIQQRYSVSEITGEPRPIKETAIGKFFRLLE